MNELLTSSSTRRPNKQRRFQQQNTLLNTHTHTLTLSSHRLTHQGGCGDELRAGEHVERSVFLSGFCKDKI